MEENYCLLMCSILCKLYLSGITSSGRRILKCLWSSSMFIFAQICVSLIPIDIPLMLRDAKIRWHSASSIGFILYFLSVVSCLERKDLGTLYNLNGQPVIDTVWPVISDIWGKHAGRICRLNSTDLSSWTNATLSYNDFLVYFGCRITLATFTLIGWKCSVSDP